MAWSAQIPRRKDKSSRSSPSNPIRNHGSSEAISDSGKSSEREIPDNFPGFERQLGGAVHPGHPQKPETHPSAILMFCEASRQPVAYLLANRRVASKLPSAGLGVTGAGKAGLNEFTTIHCWLRPACSCGWPSHRIHRGARTVRLSSVRRACLCTIFVPGAGAVRLWFFRRGLHPSPAERVSALQGEGRGNYSCATPEPGSSAGGKELKTCSMNTRTGTPRHPVAIVTELL